MLTEEVPATVKIAVYGIAKNEEQFVRSWAASAAEADVRILVDTGSTDRTVALAREAGVQVTTKIFQPWRFDIARNHALDLVPHDVDLCISLDLDEVLVPGWRTELERSLTAEATRYRYLYTWSWSHTGAPGLQYAGDKIHRRHGYTWRYPVHEVLVPVGIDEVQQWTELQIHHHRDQDKSRDQYLDLLELAVAEDPDNDRNAHYLAREYMYRQRYAAAAREFKRHLALPSATWDAERSQSMRYLATCEPDNAEQWLLQAAATTPDRREPWVDLAFWYLQAEQWSACLHTCRLALTLQRKPLEYLTEAHAWGARLDDMAANAAYQLREYELAVEHGRRAVELEPHDQRLHANLDRFEQALAQWGHARHMVDGQASWRHLPVRSVASVPAPADLPPGWVLMNPSIAGNGSAMHMVVRTTNYRLIGQHYDMADDDGVIRSRSALVDVDGQGRATNWRWITTDQVLQAAPAFSVEGVEDMRLFWHGDTWRIVGGVRDFSSSGAIRQVLATVADPGDPQLTQAWRMPSPLTKDDSALVYEKNWVAVATDPHPVNFIWSTQPLIRLRADQLTGQVVASHGHPSGLAGFTLRGSTPVIDTAHGSVYVVHEVGPSITQRPRPDRTYLHAFVTDCGDHVHVGPAWVIEELALEYVAGIAVSGDRLLVSFGRDDADARVAVCDWEQVAHLIVPTCDPKSIGPPSVTQ